MCRNRGREGIVGLGGARFGRSFHGSFESTDVIIEGENRGVEFCLCLLENMLGRKD
jgi:hypothetical protein